MKAKAVVFKTLAVFALCALLSLLSCSCGCELFKSDTVSEADCGTKTAITADEFIAGAEGLGCRTQPERKKGGVSVTARMGSDDGGVKWSVRFETFADEAAATERFEQNRSSFEKAEGSEERAKGDNCAIYEKNGGGRFKYLCRVDNTVFYADVDDEHKDEVEALIESIGY